ncbi:MAG TPA: FAD-binding oxidoreductase [Pirellulales bacterium]|nr:FAD-binding oxidoreductase [Pirellulales bacterium]
MQATENHPATSPRAATPWNQPPRWREELLSGWGNYAREACRVYRPEKLPDATRIVADPSEASLITRGLGRSYGDASVNGAGGVINLLKLNRLLAFDEATGVLECEGGVPLADIIDFALPRGFFPAVTPGTRFVTVGGAIAADVHGKNHHQDGSFASCLIDFRLLTASGEVLTCARERNARAFWATVGGMGLTGVILDARFRLRPVASAYVTVDYQRTANLDESLSAFAEGDHRYTYSVAWIDCLARGAALGRSVLMRGRHTACDELPAELAQAPLTLGASRSLRVPCHLPGGLLNAWSVKAFNALYYHRHRDRRAIVAYGSFFHPLDSILDWNRIYGRRGFAQYQAAFPPSTSRNALVSLLETISAARQASFLAVLKSFGPGNRGLLSFPIEGHTLALDLPNTGSELIALLQRLDAIVLSHGGRVYLAKDPRLGRAAFDTMYAQADEFRRVKAILDPRGRFNSSLARRLGLVADAQRARQAA